MKSKILFLIIIVLVTGSIFVAANRLKPQVSEEKDLSVVKAPSTNTPTPRPKYSKPILLTIPSQEVDAKIEYVGMDENGRMDVPKLDENVAWWSLGVVPGEAGNAVVAGHFDAKDGGPAVFYELSKLKIGDLVSIRDDQGNLINFEVYKIEKFKDDNFPIELVFGPSTFSYLNLITCDGIFDQNSKNYSDRLVVFTKLKEKTQN